MGYKGKCKCFKKQPCEAHISTRLPICCHDCIQYGSCLSKCLNDPQKCGGYMREEGGKDND